MTETLKLHEKVVLSKQGLRKSSFMSTRLAYGLEGHQCFTQKQSQCKYFCLLCAHLSNLCTLPYIFEQSSYVGLTFLSKSGELHKRNLKEGFASRTG
jgi:hypothetical protein